MISVVVPAYNAAAVLPRCLEALAHQSVDPREYEVIVVDDGSVDETAAVARHYGARLIQIPHSGPALARNRGAEAASGDILLFTDADCAPALNWVARMAAALADSTVAAAKGTYATRQPGWLPQFVQAEFEERYSRLARSAQIDFVDTYSAAFRRSVFLDSGGFDPAFPVPSAEDADLSFRLASLGHRLIFVPDAIVYHQHAARLSEYLGRKLRYGIWRARVYRQYPDKVVRDSYTPNTVRWQALLAVLLLALLPLILVWSSARALFGLLLALLLLTSLGLTRRAARRDRRLVLIAPLLVLLRAVAQVIGLGLGVLLLIRVSQARSGRLLRRLERVAVRTSRSD